jgi:hypothetical protein
VTVPKLNQEKLRGIPHPPPAARRPACDCSGDRGLPEGNRRRAGCGGELPPAHRRGPGVADGAA